MTKVKIVTENDTESTEDLNSSNSDRQLISVNKKLALQIKKNEEHTAELFAANKELAFQNLEKEKRAAELLIANAELAYQNQEKESRAAELIVANKELAFQNIQKEKRAAELLIANAELAYQNQEKEDRASELIVANGELAFQNAQKEKRAAELVIANKELAFQNVQKEKRAAELFVANAELAYQNQEKENRASELIIANAELAFQNAQKEKRAAELLQANKELETLAFISSHDLQEPLRKIQAFANRVISEETENLSEKGLYYFERIEHAALRMQTLINDLLVYSSATEKNHILEVVDLNDTIMEVLESLDEKLKEHNALVAVSAQCNVTVIPFQFRQLLYNLISNAIKFRKTETQLQVNISSRIADDNDISQRNLPSDIIFSHIRVSDTGIGFDSEFKEKIFDMFRRLHSVSEYSGTGVGLTIVKKIVENHKGYIFATGERGEGATFDLYLPYLTKSANIKEHPTK